MSDLEQLADAESETHSDHLPANSSSKQWQRIEKGMSLIRIGAILMIISISAILFLFMTKLELSSLIYYEFNRIFQPTQWLVSILVLFGYGITWVGHLQCCFVTAITRARWLTITSTTGMGFLILGYLIASALMQWVVDDDFVDVLKICLIIIILVGPLFFLQYLKRVASSTNKMKLADNIDTALLVYVIYITANIVMVVIAVFKPKPGIWILVYLLNNITQWIGWIWLYWIAGRLKQRPRLNCEWIDDE